MQFESYALQGNPSCSIACAMLAYEYALSAGDASRGWAAQAAEALHSLSLAGARIMQNDSL